MANQTEGTGGGSRATRVTRSRRSFLDSAGAVLQGDDDRMESAQGARYVLLKDDGKSDHTAFDYIFDQNKNEDRMYAILGFITKTGNTANTVFNDKKAPGDADEAAREINEIRNLIQVKGEWTAERTGGPRVDKDRLADALIAAMADAGNLPSGDDPASVKARADKREIARRRMDSDVQDDLDWFAVIRRHGPTMKHYASLMGQKEVTADQAFAGL